MVFIEVGDTLLNIEGIEFVERVDSSKMIIHMMSGKIIEITETMSINLWNYLLSQRLPFYDVMNPERNFSGT